MAETERRRLLQRVGLLSALLALPPTLQLGRASWLHWQARQDRQGQGADGEAPPDDVCIVAPTSPWNPASGQSMLAARAIPAEARCPVCGMFPARQPRWAAQLIHADGRAHFLDSPLSLFLYLQRVERYAPGYRRADVAAMYVADHNSGSWLDARQAVYVAGSRLLGPMRNGNLPAVATPAAAQALINDAGGRSLRFADLAAGLPPELQRLAPHRH